MKRGIKRRRLVPMAPEPRWRGVRWRHGVAVPSPVPRLAGGTGGCGMRRGTGMILGTGPVVLPAAREEDTGTGSPTSPCCRGPPTQTHRGRGRGTPRHPSPPRGGGWGSGTAAIPGTAPGHTGWDTGAGDTPRRAGRVGVWPLRDSGAHLCPSPMGSGQRLQPPPESCREHPGDGKWLRVTMETGPPARHAEGTCVLGPEERGTGRTGHRERCAGHQALTAGSSAPCGRATEPIARLGPAPASPGGGGRRVAGCHLTGMPPRCVARRAALHHYTGARGRSRLFPEQPPDDVHRQGYNLAKHSAGALEGAGPHRLISQSRTHRDRASHSNEGTCSTACRLAPARHTRAGAIASYPHPAVPGGQLCLRWPIPAARSERRPPPLISAGPGPGRQPAQRGGRTAQGTRVGLRTRGCGRRQMLHACSPPLCAGVSVHPCRRLSVPLHVPGWRQRLGRAVCVPPPSACCNPDGQ